MDELLKLLKERKSGGAIQTADAYLKTLAPCAAGEACATTFFEFGTLDQWKTALKESESKLVYRNLDCIVESGLVADREDESGVSRFGGSKGWNGKTLSEKSIMDFECVITSTRKDRDNDILEASGAEVDPKMPLLWQHMPMMPIGKLVEVTNRNSKRIKGHFAIADTPLGRDAAQLTEFGALRISHGFKPLKFERLEKGDEEMYAGFHILKFVIMETSVVSVPSNEDAVITLHSAGKLHHPAVKSWADELWSSMPKSVVGGFDRTKSVETKTTGGKQDINITLSLRDIEKGNKRCGCEGGTGSSEGDKDAALSEGGVKALKESLELLTEALKSGDLTAIKAGITKASEKIKAVVENPGNPGHPGVTVGDTQEPKDTEAKCVELMVALMKGEVDWQLLHDLKDAVESAIGVQTNDVAELVS